LDPGELAAIRDGNASLKERCATAEAALAEIAMQAAHAEAREQAGLIRTLSRVFGRVNSFRYKRW
jgi:hypothetical protein